MKEIFLMVKKELQTAFLSPIAYVMVAGFMILSGVFFFGLLDYYNVNLSQAALNPNETPRVSEWVVYPFFKTLEIIFVFLIPVLTMRLIAEERNQGTYELLLTAPIRVSTIVWGKFLGSALVLLIMIIFASIYPIVLLWYMKPEVLPMLSGILGLFLLVLAFASIGLFCSAIAQSQTVAGILAFTLLIVLYVIDLPTAKVGESLGFVLGYLSPAKHTELLFRGVLESRDIIYFLSVISLGLFFTSRVLDAERWR